MHPGLCLDETARHEKLWIEVRSSLWFVPGVLVLLAIGLALGLVELDLAFAQQLQAQRWQPLLNTGAEGARGMLTAIASSMITVAGVAFSMTIVTLSLASTQYTPRILRNFMRDRANQFVLGVFVAIFTYCLIVLRTIRGGAEKDGAGLCPDARGRVRDVARAPLDRLPDLLHPSRRHFHPGVQYSERRSRTKRSRRSKRSSPKDIGDEEEQPAADRPRSTAHGGIAISAQATGYLAAYQFGGAAALRGRARHDPATGAPAG